MMFIVALILAVFTSFWTVQVAHNTAPMPGSAKFGDMANEHMAHEAAYWAGRGPPPGPTYGPTFDGACGLHSWTHHPPGPTYAQAASIWLGNTAGAAQYIMLAAATLVILLVLAYVSPRESIALAVLILSLLTWAPGYAGHLQDADECVWPIAAMFLLGAAAMARKPYWPIAIAAAFASYTFIALTPFAVAIIAGALVARHGLTKTTAYGGLSAIAGWVFVFLAYQIQVICHSGWSLTTYNAIYISGTDVNNYATSFLLRVSDHTFLDRIKIVNEHTLLYATEVLRNAYEYGQPWTEAPFWFVLPVVFLLCRAPQWRSLLGVVVFLFALWASFLIIPGLLPPHLHHLPRMVLYIPLGLVIVLGAVPNPIRIPRGQLYRALHRLGPVKNHE